MLFVDFSLCILLPGSGEEGLGYAAWEEEVVPWQEEDVLYPSLQDVWSLSSSQTSKAIQSFSAKMPTWTLLLLGKNSSATHSTHNLE